MDPPLISETTFTAANPASYSLSEIWPSTSLPPEETKGGTTLLDLRKRHLGSGFGDGNGPSSAPAEESTVTEQSSGGCGGSGRKRRGLSSEEEGSKLVSTTSTGSNGGVGASELNHLCAKWVKNSGSTKGNSNLKVEMESSSDGNKQAEQIGKQSKPPKGYIHVRARRGQATDNHSLAERARREKISERMKVLQDLVPGCNKVIGKALVLEEIINYILSLHHQVEFLSMKLEAVNSCLNINPTFEGFHAKDLGAQPSEASGMMFGQQTTRQYVQGSQAEQLHLQRPGDYERTT